MTRGRVSQERQQGQSVRPGACSCESVGSAVQARKSSAREARRRTPKGSPADSGPRLIRPLHRRLPTRSRSVLHSHAAPPRSNVGVTNPRSPTTTPSARTTQHTTLCRFRAPSLRLHLTRPDHRCQHDEPLARVDRRHASLQGAPLWPPAPLCVSASRCRSPLATHTLTTTHACLRADRPAALRRNGARTPLRSSRRLALTRTSHTGSVSRELFNHPSPPHSPSLAATESKSQSWLSTLAAPFSPSNPDASKQLDASCVRGRMLPRTQWKVRSTLPAPQSRIGSHLGTRT